MMTRTHTMNHGESMLNIIEWDYESRKRMKKIRFAFGESGGSFLKKFPFYTNYLVKNSHIIVYMLPLD